MDVTDVAGIDVGLTLVERTSGVCRTGSSGDLVTHTYIDRLSRSTALGGNLRFSVLAIDAPVLPEGQLHYDARSCEKVFVWGDFQKRCKCGESWVRGTGQALRRAGVDTAHAFADIVWSNEPTSPFPRVFDSRNIVEAFPNAFLGVSLPDGVFESTPSRGEKFDWLYDQWLEYKMPEVLQAALRWHREQYWGAVSENRHHDERAALVCALTGICVLQGLYVAVGEPTGGYFFLPPWNAWAEWARSAVDKSRGDRRLPKPIDVWIQGKRYAPKDELPKVAPAG